MKHRYWSSLALALLLLTTLATPAFAKGPPVDEIHEYVLERINPCTGEEHLYYLTEKLHIHEFENKNMTHLNIQYFWEVTTDDGYWGTGVGPDVFSISEKRETYTIIANGTLKNDSGQTIKVRKHIHFTVLDGEFKVVKEDVTRWCLGKSD
jgi:hypothetical protein